MVDLKDYVNPDLTPEYEEKVWGKDDHGEFITDGYTFKGKRAFNKAIVGLKATMKKGVEHVIEKIKFKALDARNNGAGFEIVIEVTENGNRGVAILKLFGPNVRKLNVVSVTKSKGSGHEFVIILAEKIVKPLMAKYLKDEIAVDPFVEVKKEIEKHRCPHCEKIFTSGPGLKCHITKMHKSKKVGVRSKRPSCHSVAQKSEVNKKSSDKEVSTVIENLLTDVIEISDDEGSVTIDANVTLEESVEKEYINACEHCDYRITASRKYIALQLVRKHKEECHFKTCCDCEFRAKNLQEMKRHVRDEHNITSYSTSPPMKKKRIRRMNSIESMDITSELFKSNDEKDLSFKFEEMEIDEDEDAKERESRSRMWDEKIKVKKQKTKEEEDIIEKKRTVRENKRKLDEKQQMEEVKKTQKQQRQWKKDLKMKKKKSIKRTQHKSPHSNHPSKIPNISPVPENCIHLVKEGDVVYVVPGDGCCGPNCAAAFLFQDEVFGPKLRRRMNVFQAEHWVKKYQYKTQCSPGHPFVRKTRGGKVSFTDPMELLKFLRYSKKSAYMWSDSEDLAIISDMYQLKIKVITVKDSMDKNPTINWICPDEDMKEFAELKDVELDEMVLLHQNDVHFNLIISKNNDLAKYGSLSYRFNVGPTVDSEECVDTEFSNEDEDLDDSKNEDNKKLKKELNKYKESLKSLESEYGKCIQELRRKTTEAEKLKSELKDLREIVKLGEKLNSSTIDSEKMNEEEEVLLKMKSSGARRINPQFQSSPSKPEKSPKSGKASRPVGSDKKPQFNCEECFFQGTQETELHNHIKIKHTLNANIDGFIKCRNCGMQFKTKRDLMNHRKKEHSSSVAPCRNYINKTCSFSAELCWWNHAENKNDNIECFVCGITFEHKSSLMKHRKLKHASIVKSCVQYKEMKCRYDDISCWFKHKEEEQDVDTSSVFQNASKKKEPPIQNQ